MAPKPWEHYRFQNVWNEPKDKAFEYRGHPAAGKHIAGKMLETGFDVSYAYRPLHHQLGHAFLNTLLFLDYDRQGFPYPVLPFQVNCYGRRVIAQQAGVRSLSELPAENDLDPPSPLPWRCFDLGAACARIAADSPYRVALIASSSWSHAFLTPKNYLLYPDVPADRGLYDALVKSDYAAWRERPAERGRRQRTTGDPELDVPDGRDERAGKAADRDVVCRKLDFQLKQMLCGLRAVTDAVGSWNSGWPGTGARQECTVKRRPARTLASSARPEAQAGSIAS